MIRHVSQSSLKTAGTEASKARGSDHACSTEEPLTPDGSEPYVRPMRSCRSPGRKLQVRYAAHGLVTPDDVHRPGVVAVSFTGAPDKIA